MSTGAGVGVGAAVVVLVVRPAVGEVTTSRERVLEARGGSSPTTPAASASFATATAAGRVEGGASDARDSHAPPPGRCSDADSVLQDQYSGAAASLLPSGSSSPLPGAKTGSQAGTLMSAPRPDPPSPAGGRTSNRQTALSSLENQNSTLSACAPVPKKVKRLHSALPIASTPSKMPAAEKRSSSWVTTVSLPSSSGRSRHSGAGMEASSTSTASCPGSSATEMFVAPGIWAPAVTRTWPCRTSAAKLPAVKVWPPAAGSPFAGPRYSEYSNETAGSRQSSGRSGSWTMMATSPVSPRISRTAKSVFKLCNAKRASCSSMERLCTSVSPR
mmetsp:Transcript_79151/g.223809  ORF Transcript_79151/g.223809 Transcript_79151/m.223809 type:complete len:330 (-) Transcript_79151:1418-2407(-)